MTPDNMLTDLTTLGAFSQENGQPYQILVEVSYDFSQVLSVVVSHDTTTYGLQAILRPHESDFDASQALCLVFTTQATRATPDWVAMSEAVAVEAASLSTAYIYKIVDRGGWDVEGYLRRAHEAHVGSLAVVEHIGKRLNLILCREMGHKVMTDIMAAAERHGLNLTDERFGNTLRLSEEGFDALDRIEQELISVEGSL
jgi:hypothetical protein